MSKAIIEKSKSNVKEVITEQIKATEKTSLEMLLALDTKVDTVEQLEKAVQLFGQLDTTDKNDTNFAIVSTIETAVQTRQKKEAVAPYALLNNADLFNALCNVTIAYKATDTVKTTEKNIKLALSYTEKYVKNDNFVLTIKEKSKPITVADVFDSKSKLIASRKADTTVTDEDEKKAMNEIIDGISLGVLYCNLHTACVLGNISPKKIECTAEYNKVYNALDAMYKSQNKENIFAKVSRNALQKQLELTASTLLNTTEYDSKCTKDYAQMFCNMLVRTNDNGVQYEITDILKVAQMFVTVCRYMFNTIPPLFKVNKTIHTTK